MVIGSTIEAIELWNLADGRLLARMEPKSGTAYAVAFSPDSRQAIAAGRNGTATIWSTQTGELLATTVQGPDDEWITITPEGFFVASPKGAELVHLVRGFQTTGIEQLYQALYRPDLVQEKLAGDPQGRVREAAAKIDLGKVIASGAAPQVSLAMAGASPPSGTSGSIAVSSEPVTLEATATDQGGGIGRVEWRLNGVTLGVDDRGLTRLDGAPATGTAASAGTLTARKTLTLDAGESTIEVVAYNAEGLIASNPALLKLTRSGGTAAAKPRLHVLSIGVNDYWDGRLKLNFAVSDAQAMAQAFEKVGEGLYESVKVTTVLDGAVTREQLDQVFAQLAAQIGPSDVFVQFVAGHGRTVDGQYYFIPQDFRYQDEGSYGKSGISQAQWQQWTSSIQARKSILIYDTCESGTLTADQPAARGLVRMEEQATAIEKLKQATGRTVLAASSDTQPALEGYHGHGVFSYAVLEALEKGPVNKDGLIELTGLISFVDAEVPELSFQAFKQRQVPQTKFNGSNFAFAKPATILGAGPAAAAGAAVIPTKPTHVVIAPVQVRRAASATAPVVTELAPGSQVTLVKTASGWVIIARDGKELGYVQESALARLQ
jgi:hypothetical protein